MHWKEALRRHYDRVLGRLLRDLRIFAVSNLIAAALAIFLATRTGGDAAQLVWISFLLFAGIAYCVYSYIDRFSFFKILFDLHLGWWYPVLIATTFLTLLFKFGRPRDSQPALRSAKTHLAGTSDFSE